MFAVVKRVAGPMALLALFIVGDIAPAMAQRSSSNDNRLRSRIDLIERDLQDLQEQLDEQASSSSVPDQSFTSQVRSENLPATALLDERVDNLDVAVRGLTGEVERLQYLVNRLGEQLERVSADFDYRLRALEGNLSPGEEAPRSEYPQATYSATPGYGGLQGAPLGAAQGSGDAGVMDITPAPVTAGAIQMNSQGAPLGSAPLAGAGQPQSLGSVAASNLGGNEESDFEIGMQLLRQGDFAGAETTFQEFITTYPESGQMGEAYFWLGESLYVRGLYSDAATSYLTSARDFGDSTKAPDSLLKLGMSLAAIGQVDQACSAFNQVSRSYPDASNRVTRNVTREQAANNCS